MKIKTTINIFVNYPGATPTLIELISFPMSGSKVNLPEKIVDYRAFGTLLLMDDYGNRITAITKELMGNAADINFEVLRLWLEGKGRQPVTWATLVTVLREIRLEELAKDIEAVKMA
jgi:hypothetical protein